MNIRTHSGFILFASTVFSAGLSIGLGILLYQTSKGSLPIWLYIVMVMTCFALGLVFAEASWRTYRFLFSVPDDHNIRKNR